MTSGTLSSRIPRESERDPVLKQGGAHFTDGETEASKGHTAGRTELCTCSASRVRSPDTPLSMGGAGVTCGGDDASLS